MILIAFGSNLSFCGQPSAVIVERAVKALGEVVDIQAVSRFYASPSWPDHNNPAYVNAVVSGQSDLTPDALMAVFAYIGGRIRPHPGGEKRAQNPRCRSSGLQ